MSGRLTKIADKALTVYIRIVFRLDRQLLFSQLLDACLVVIFQN